MPIQTAKHRKKTKADIKAAKTHKKSPQTSARNERCTQEEQVKLTQYFAAAANKRACYVIVAEEFVPEKGFRACVCIEGEPGYRPTGDWPYTDASQVYPYFWGGDLSEAEQIAEKQNERLGLSKLDVARIVASTMRAQATFMSGEPHPDPDADE